MARLPRLSVAGQPHLVLLRGLDHQSVVIDDQDRRQCLAALFEAALLQRLAVHAYMLMDDRLRLLATPPEAESLGLAMQDFGRRYVGAFNRRHGRHGTLWDGRFRASVVQPGPLALKAMVFVDTEPVCSGRVAAASEHPWSSALHHLGRQRDPLLRTLGDYWQLGNTPFERESHYARRLTEGLSAADAARLADACQKGWAIGDADYLAQLSGVTQRPMLPRPRGRPAKGSADAGRR